jgi:hypothetical protein
MGATMQFVVGSYGRDNAACGELLWARQCSFDVREARVVFTRRANFTPML